MDGWMDGWVDGWVDGWMNTFPGEWGRQDTHMLTVKISDWLNYS